MAKGTTLGEIVATRLRRLNGRNVRYSNLIIEYAPYSPFLDTFKNDDVVLGVMLKHEVAAIDEYKIEGESIELDKEGKLVLYSQSKEIHGNKLWFLFFDHNKEYDVQHLNDKFDELEKAVLFTDSIELINRHYVNYANADANRKLDYCNQRIIDLNNEINQLKERIAKREQEIENNNKSIKELLLLKPKSITEELENIKKHKHVKDMYYNSLRNTLHIKTDTLYMTHPQRQGDRRLLGEMTITINLEYFSVLFENLEYRRTSYWGEECHHPHVEQNGDACLGNLANMLCECKETGSVYAAYLLCLGFLETYEPNDPAGQYYVCWDRVDEAGNVVEKGQENRYAYSCTHCGAGMYDEDVYWCEECQEAVCDSCVVYVGDYYLCPECAENNTTVCEDCGERHFNDDIYTDYDGRSICINCKNDHYVTCANCEDYVHADEAIYDVDTELYYCPECAPTRREERSDV
jgi:hypothetical protein